MDEKRLRKTLERLNDEIDHAQNMDEKGKALLERTRADVQRLLRQAEADPSASHADTASRLEETIAYLEATHPQLTLAMTDLLDILSNAGI